MASESVKKVYLQPGREASVKRQHPWLFSGAVARVVGKVAPGELVSVFSHDGMMLGRGHWAEGSIAVKLFDFGESALSEAELVSQLISEAWQRRSVLGLIDGDSTNGFRLIHAEGDGLPGLVVDKFASTFVIQFQSLGMYRLSETICTALRELGGAGLVCIYQKAFDQGSEGAQIEGQYLFGKPASHEFVECGLKFKVDWEQGQKTGFFLDQRDNRSLLRSYARGKAVLNCFSYSGGFSVAAFAGGARSVLSVDSSRAALKLCEENVNLNCQQADHRVLEADCLQYLHTLSDEYDLIVLDPPAFIKHRGAFKGGLKGYETINLHAMRAARPHSLLFTFSCSQLLSKDDFWDLLSRVALRAERKVKVLHTMRQAACHPVSLQHPEADYLKGFVLEIS